MSGGFRFPIYYWFLLCSMCDALNLPGRARIRDGRLQKWPQLLFALERVYSRAKRCCGVCWGISPRDKVFSWRLELCADRSTSWHHSLPIARDLKEGWANVSVGEFLNRLISRLRFFLFRWVVVWEVWVSGCHHTLAVRDRWKSQLLSLVFCHEWFYW